jgi:hypothetical protein
MLILCIVQCVCAVDGFLVNDAASGVRCSPSCNASTLLLSIRLHAYILYGYKGIKNMKSFLKLQTSTRLILPHLCGDIRQVVCIAAMAPSAVFVFPIQPAAHFVTLCKLPDYCGWSSFSQAYSVPFFAGRV